MRTTPDLHVLDRLREAIDSHDPARVAACFADDYRAELPHHPDRSFTGADHVLRNWTAIFATVSDLTATILRTATSGAEVWSEWEMRGTDATGADVTFAWAGHANHPRRPDCLDPLLPRPGGRAGRLTTVELAAPECRPPMGR